MAENRPYTLRRKYVEVAWGHSPEDLQMKMIDAVQVNDSPLHVYKSASQWWVVQVPTGFAVKYFSTMGAATQFAANIEELIDWDFKTHKEFGDMDTRSIKDYLCNGMGYRLYTDKEKILHKKDLLEAYGEPIHKLSNKLAEAEGYPTVGDMLDDFVTSSLVPGICNNCEYMQDIEADCQDGHCPSCGEYEFNSCMTMEGMV